MIKLETILTEKQAGYFKARNDAMEHAKKRAQKFTDNQSFMMVFQLPDYSYDVNAEMNSQGRDAIKAAGGKLVATVTRNKIKTGRGEEEY